MADAGRQAPRHGKGPNYGRRHAYGNPRGNHKPWRPPHVGAENQTGQLEPRPPTAQRSNEDQRN